MAQRILLGELIHKLANKYQDKPCLTMAPSGETLSWDFETDLYQQLRLCL